MKKILSMAAIALFMMTASCSSDDDSTPVTEQSNLIKKTVMTTEDGLELVTNYNYNGNKIVSIVSSDDSSTTFVYTGDLITEVKYYEDGELVQTEAYTYTSDNKLATHTMFLTQDYARKGEFTYNANNTITINYFTGDAESQTTPSGTYTLTVANENITQVNTGSSISTAVYDSGFDPMYNITGYQAVNLAYNEGGKNNVISSTGDNVLGEAVLQYTTTYTYNGANYPVTADETDVETGEVYHVEVFYE